MTTNTPADLAEIRERDAKQDDTLLAVSDRGTLLAAYDEMVKKYQQLRETFEISSTDRELQLEAQLSALQGRVEAMQADFERACEILRDFGHPVEDEEWLSDALKEQPK